MCILDLKSLFIENSVARTLVADPKLYLYKIIISNYKYSIDFEKLYLILKLSCVNFQV